MRDAAINLRALPEQRDLIDQAAQLLGKNRSDFMLEAACDRAQSVVLDQVFFSLDATKFRQFNALLDAPAALNHSKNHAPCILLDVGLALSRLAGRQIGFIGLNLAHK